MPDTIIGAGENPSQAQYLFDRFTGLNGVANIRALVGQTPRVTETNWLEFKTGKVRDEDIKPLWSKALSSFANSGGGVMVWGIRADRDKETGIDAVQEEVLAPDAERLAGKLRELQPPATDPPIRGAMVQSLLLPGSDKEGFVVCLIPESDSKPHRSEFGKNDVKRFYMRIGDSTQECTVPILRQLFSPKVFHRVALEIERIPTPPRLGTFHHKEQGVPWLPVRQDTIHLSVRNIGSYTIQEVVLDISCGTARLIEFEWLKHSEKYSMEFVGRSLLVARALHPTRSTSNRLLVALRSNDVVNIEVVLSTRDMQPLSASIPYREIVAQPWNRQVTIFQ